MATDFWYNNAAFELDRGNIDLSADTVKAMLSEHGASTAHVPDKDDVFVDEAGDDALQGEIETVDNYTGGYAGASRLTLANKTETNNTTDDRSVFDNTVDLTWSTLGGTTDLTIRYCTIWNSTANSSSTDANSWVMFSLDVNGDTGILTNGGDFTVQFNAAGVAYSQQ